MHYQKEQVPKTATDLKLNKRIRNEVDLHYWELYNLASNHGGQAFAVKRTDLSAMERYNLKDRKAEELDKLRRLSHPYIAELLFHFCDVSYDYLGMEHGEQMWTLLIRASTLGGAFSRQQSAQYFYEVCDALEYLHGLPEPIVHRDIKPEAIILDKDGHAKLMDFFWSGLLTSKEPKLTEFCGNMGSLEYISPEMIRGEAYDTSLDMWSMGVLLYEMTTCNSPFAGNSKEDTCRNILKMNFRFPDHMDPDCRNLIKSLFVKAAPSQRPQSRTRFPTPRKLGDPLPSRKMDARLTAAAAKRDVFVKRFHKTGEVILTVFVATRGNSCSQVKITNMAGVVISTCEISQSSTFGDLEAELVRQFPDLHGRFKLLLPHGIDLTRLQAKYPVGRFAELNSATICLHETPAFMDRISSRMYLSQLYGRAEEKVAGRTVSKAGDCARGSQVALRQYWQDALMSVGSQVSLLSRTSCW